MKQENLIEQTPAEEEVKAKPEGLLDKFWDEEKGEVKLNELIEDYNFLASRDDNLVETNNRVTPESYDKYELNIPHPFLERDEDVLKKLFEHGFSNEQAQLVYDLANERVIPVLDELAVDFEARRQLEKLAEYFGGEERFNVVSRQISNWAKNNLQTEVYDALATTSEGVIALYKMMSSNEPNITKEVSKVDDLTEDTLKRMMQDPRYWRDRDKAYIAKVKAGFDQLYPENN